MEIFGSVEFILLRVVKRSAIRNKERTWDTPLDSWYWFRREKKKSDELVSFKKLTPPQKRSC